MSHRPGATWAPANPNNYTPGRPGKIDTLVWHTMVGTERSARARFQSPSGGASAHYGVCLDGSLVQYVDDVDTAWHAGNWSVNQRSIGVEHEDNHDYNGPRTPELYERSAQLMAALLRENPTIPRRRTSSQNGGGVARHHDVSLQGTACPDSLDVDRIFARALELLAPPSPPPPPQEELDMTPAQKDYKGRLHMVAVGSDGALWRSDYGPGEPFANLTWTSLGVPAGGVRSGVSLEATDDGALVALVEGADRHYWRIFTMDGKWWTPWEQGSGIGE